MTFVQLVDMQYQGDCQLNYEDLHALVYKSVNIFIWFFMKIYFLALFAVLRVIIKVILRHQAKNDVYNVKLFFITRQ